MQANGYLLPANEAPNQPRPDPVKGVGVVKGQSRPIEFGSTAISFGANRAGASGSIGMLTYRTFACG